MEGKALRGWAPERERALDTLIDRIHPGKGGEGDVLAADPGAFDDSLDLATGRREPAGAVEEIMPTNTDKSTAAPNTDLEREIATYLSDFDAAEREQATERINRRVALTAPTETVDPGRFTFEPNLGEIAKGGIPEPERLIPNLLYEGRVHWLSGHPGHGKTTLAAFAAKQHMDAGGHVVWLDWEGGLRPTVARMLAVGATAEQLDAQFHLAVCPALQASAEGFAPIAATLADYPGALVVFDSASKALSAAGFDENSSTEATKWTTQIILPTREAGATVVVIDHVVKGATKTTPYARGAGSKLADTDVSWYVEATVKFNRETPGRIELTRHKDREGLLPERIAFEVGDGQGNLPITPAEVEDEGTRSKREAGMRGKVLAALQEHSTPERRLTKNQIDGIVAGRRTAVLAALDELAADKSTGVRVEPAGRSVLYWHDPDAATGLDIRGGEGA